jgi:hypothetical protein
MLKIPLETHCNCFLSYVSSCHISSQIQATTILASLSLYFSTILYISLINKNCVLLYLCVYGCISNIYIFYIILSLSICMYICVYISTLISCQK